MDWNKFDLRETLLAIRDAAVFTEKLAKELMAREEAKLAMLSEFVALKATDQESQEPTEE